MVLDRNLVNKLIRKGDTHLGATQLRKEPVIEALPAAKPVSHPVECHTWDYRQVYFRRGNHRGFISRFKYPEGSWRHGAWRILPKHEILPYHLRKDHTLSRSPLRNDAMGIYLVRKGPEGKHGRSLPELFKCLDLCPDAGGRGFARPLTSYIFP